MKRSLIALSVAAAVLAPAAEAAPKVYGKINITAESFKNDAKANGIDDTTRLVSNASRFGLKGEDELTAELSAIYQLEWQVNTDGDNTDLTARNRYLGLKHATYGQVKLGQFDSYLKLSEGESDLFNDYYGDIDKVHVGENRIKNVVAYMSPTIEGFNFNVQVQTNDTAANAAAPGTGAGQSASLSYTNEEAGLYVAIAADRGITGKGAVYTSAAASRDAQRAVVTYKTGDLLLTGMYTIAELEVPVVGVASDGKEAGYHVGAAYTLGDEVLKVQYGKAEAKQVDADVKLLSVGVDHMFTSKTKAVLFYTKYDGNTAVTGTGVKTKVDQNVIAFGLEHKF